MGTFQHGLRASEKDIVRECVKFEDGVKKKD